MAYCRWSDVLQSGAQAHLGVKAMAEQTWLGSFWNTIASYSSYELGPSGQFGTIPGSGGRAGVYGSSVVQAYADLGKTSVQLGILGGAGASSYFNAQGDLIVNGFGYVFGFGVNYNYNVTQGRTETAQFGVMAGAGVEFAGYGASAKVAPFMIGMDTIAGQPQAAITASVQGSAGRGLVEGTINGQANIGVLPVFDPNSNQIVFGDPSTPFYLKYTDLNRLGDPLDRSEPDGSVFQSVPPMGDPLDRFEPDG